MMQFEIQQEPGSIIKVIGVGGGGSNAVNHMFKLGIKGVDFIVCNTDKQALEVSPVPNKIQLGIALTKGLGAGSIPEMGKNSALETIEEIRSYLSDGTQMVFITAGLGGGTGTGAAPIIASVARDMGILSVGIVTMPFVFEGKKRKQQAEQGLEEMKKYVDTLLVIGNDKLRDIYGNLKMSEAFAHADNVLTGAAKSIAEIISINLHINVDFNDVKTVMKDSGVAIMGTASASGERRAIRAVEQALNSPLLNDNNIRGARHVLLNIMSGTDDISMDEFGEITDYIQEASGYTAELITGYGIDQSLGDSVGVTIIATGFDSNKPSGFETAKQPEKIVNVLESHKPEAVVEPVVTNTIVVQTNIEEVIKEEAKKEDEPFLLIKKSEETTAEITSTNTQEEISAVSNEESEIEFVVTNESSSNEIVNEEEYSFTNNASESTDSSEEEMTMEIKMVSSSNEVEGEAKSLENLSAEDLQKLEREERIRMAQDRIKKLKDITFKLKSSEGLNELEKEPSFVRQNIKLDNVNYSTESNVSRYTLSEGDDKKMEIKPNNSFLHDNVD
ncbi:MAG TPA: cell division protein FtsZ [Bacteroidia bacterium]|nr:cell division protein FtsZ [Bacteroidia bacterium]